MMGLEGAGAQLKEEAFISICDLLIVFGHCGEATGQAPLKPLAFKPDEGMGVLLNIFIQDHVFIEDEDEDIDDHQKIEELHKRRFDFCSDTTDYIFVNSGISLPATASWLFTTFCQPNLLQMFSSTMSPSTMTMETLSR